MSERDWYVWLPGRTGVRGRLWHTRHDRLQAKIRRRIRRVERERERLRRELAHLNYHIIRGIQPPERQDDFGAREAITKDFLDPTLDHVERMTGWRFGYEAEPRQRRPLAPG
jgi:hypothetical protein